MEIPTKINNIIQRIIESEDRWKALYMASWGCANFYLRPMFKDLYPYLWDKEIPFGLPASKNKQHVYIPAKLYEILTSKDMEFTFGHLQTLFSLLEELINELCFLVCDGQEINAYKFENLKKFLSGNEPYEKFKIDISENDFKELKLAKETRNCFIHNNSKIDEKWRNAYEEAREANIEIKIGEELSKYIYVPQIEDWHELVVRIVNNIKDTIYKDEY